MWLALCIFWTLLLYTITSFLSSALPCTVLFLEMGYFLVKLNTILAGLGLIAVMGYTGTLHVTLLGMVTESQSALLEHQGCKRHFHAEPR